MAEGKTFIRWTLHEMLQMQLVDPRIASAQDDRVLGPLIEAAQQVLPASRQRSRVSMASSRSIAPTALTSLAIKAQEQANGTYFNQAQLKRINSARRKIFGESAPQIDEGNVHLSAHDLLEGSTVEPARPATVSGEAWASLNTGHIVRQLRPDDFVRLAQSLAFGEILSNRTDPDRGALLDAFMKAQVEVFPRMWHRKRKNWTDVLHKRGGTFAMMITLRRAREQASAPPYPELLRELALDQAQQAIEQIEREAEADKPLDGAAPERQLPPTPTPEPTITAPSLPPVMSSPLVELAQAAAPLLRQILAQAFGDGLRLAVQEAVPILRGLAQGQNADELRSQITQDVRQAIADLLGSSGGTTPRPEQPSRSPPADPVASSPPKLSMPRVDIIGAYPVQIAQIKERYGNAMLLRFLDIDEPRKEISGEHAIITTRRASHKDVDRIKKAKAELHYANGGVDTIYQCLQQISASHAFHERPLQ